MNKLLQILPILKKDKYKIFINLCFIAQIIILIYLSQTVVLDYLFGFFNYLNQEESAKNILDFYKTYIRKPIELGTIFKEAPLYFDIFIRFPFEKVLFKFIFLNTIFLLILKYGTFNGELSKNNFFILYGLLFVCIILVCFYTKYDYGFLATLKYIFSGDLTNIFQYITSVLFFISLIIYALINILIVHENNLKLYAKIIFMFIVAFLLFNISYSVWDFLRISIDFAHVGDQDMVFVYLCKTYGIPVADCMNAQPKTIDIERCLEYHEKAKKQCKEAMRTRDIFASSQCKELLNAFNAECKNMLQNNKRK